MIKLFHESRQVRRWIKYAVIPSFIPILFIVAYDIILGCTLANIVNKHLVDFILIVFAIAVSVYSSAKILNKKVKSDIDEEKSDNYVLCSLLVGIWCTGFFTFLYDKLKPEDSLSYKKIIFCFVQIIITIFIIYIGMKTENKSEQISISPSSESTTNTQSQEENQSNV